MKRIIAGVILAGMLGFTACQKFSDAMTSHTDVVARVEGHELTVDDATSLLAQNQRLPAQTDVVEALANLWVDYVVLAQVVTEDPELSEVDFDALLRPFLEQEMIRKLGDEVLDTDAEVSDDELKALFDEEQPGAEVRARHILLRVADDADEAERDSVREQAAELRERALAGSDFAELASEHSEDPGSSDQGGDLGFFSRGDMMAPFEEAAFALEVGDVSEVVETPYGYHVIKLDERRSVEFEDVKEEFREQTLMARQQDAEEGYIQSLTEPLNIQVQDGAFEVARELADKPNMQLSGRAASRPLVSYQGGSYTAGQYQEEMRRFTQSLRARYSEATDDQLGAVLQQLTQREILVAEARSRGIEIDEEERAELEAQVRTQLDLTAEAGGLKGIEPQEGETRAQAINRKVLGLLEGIVRDERQVVPVEPTISHALREQHKGEIFERSFSEVVNRVQANAATAPEEADPQPAETPAPNDTANPAGTP